MMQRAIKRHKTHYLGIKLCVITPHIVEGVPLAKDRISNQPLLAHGQIISKLYLQSILLIIYILPQVYSLGNLPLF